MGAYELKSVLCLLRRLYLLRSCQLKVTL